MKMCSSAPRAALWRTCWTTRPWGCSVGQNLSKVQKTGLGMALGSIWLVVTESQLLLSTSCT